jgi:hypothetical protein
MENVNRIVCIGNSRLETETYTQYVAEQFKLPYLGRLKTIDFDTVGCGCVTILEDLNLSQWHSVARTADLIVRLDQPEESFDNHESWQKTQISTRWYSHYKPVIYQNQCPDLYITRSLLPPRIFNSVRINIHNNQELIDEVFKHDITNRRVILEFTRLDQQKLLPEFLTNLDLLVQHCRKSFAKFVMLRADEHEEQDIHYSITYQFCQYPEFMLLMPEYFNKDVNRNLNTALNQHWNKLYPKSYESIQI